MSGASSAPWLTSFVGHEQMAKLRILSTCRNFEPKTARFDVEFLGGKLQVGDLVRYFDLIATSSSQPAGRP